MRNVRSVDLIPVETVNKTTAPVSKKKKKKKKKKKVSINIYNFIIIKKRRRLLIIMFRVVMITTIFLLLFKVLLIVTTTSTSTTTTNVMGFVIVQPPQPQLMTSTTTKSMVKNEKHYIIHGHGHDQYHVPKRSCSSSSRCRRRLYAADSMTSSDTDTIMSSSIDTNNNSRKDDISKEQSTFLIGYMNKYHMESFHIPVISMFSTIGIEMSKANTWSGNSYTIVNATLIHISLLHNCMIYNVTIYKRDQQQQYEYRNVSLSLYPKPIRNIKQNDISKMIGPDSFYNELLIDSTNESTTTTLTTTTTTQRRINPTSALDDIIRLLCRLCWYINSESSIPITGKLIQLGIQLQQQQQEQPTKEGSTSMNRMFGIGQLPENMYLNQVPHNVYVRQWFYDTAAIAIHDTIKLIQQEKLFNRHKVITLFPETNPSMDSYRVGTLLELIRSVVLRLVIQERLRVRICVQSSMGVGIFTGVPKQLSGVMKLLQLMDWQSNVGEEYEGILNDYIRFGSIGPDHVYDTIRDTYNDTIITQYPDDVYLIIAPQSMVGTDTSIIPLLSEMCTTIGTKRPIILFNPDLTDKISSGGQQSIRGRQERINFANTFTTCFQFQNIYISGTSYFPILGAITKLHPEEPYIAYQRRDYANNEGEVYIPVLAGENMPDGEMILSAFER